MGIVCDPHFHGNVIAMHCGRNDSCRRPSDCLFLDRRLLDYWCL